MRRNSARKPRICFEIHGCSIMKKYEIEIGVQMV